MAKVSVIIPSRNERFLQNTVADVLRNASGDVEVIAVLDGYWPQPFLPEDPRVRYIHFGRAKGMRNAINSAAAIACGEYLMKCDGHVAFAEGFDEVLKSDCDDNWLVIPRRFSLDAENWKPQKEPIDYHYLDSLLTNPEYLQMHGVIWRERGRARAGSPAYDIDDTMSWQGSAWFCKAEHFHERIGGLSEFGYGTFSQEPQEIGLKTQLGGGRLMVNKRTWYAHLHKGKQYGRGYSQNREEIRRGHMYSAWYWATNQWEERIYDFEWLIKMYWPVPGWPDNWEELLYNLRKKYPKPDYEGNMT